MTDPANATNANDIAETAPEQAVVLADGNDSGSSNRETIDQLSTAYARMREEIGKAIVGQHEIVDQLLIALFSGGHCLLTGPPGLACCAAHTASQPPLRALAPQRLGVGQSAWAERRRGRRLSRG